jgi:hypothetical protein
MAIKLPVPVSALPHFSAISWVAIRLVLRPLGLPFCEPHGLIGFLFRPWESSSNNKNADPLSVDARSCWQNLEREHFNPLDMHPPSEAEREAIAKELLCSDAARNATFSRYFKFYTSITCPSSSESTSIQVDNPAFDTHADILGCVKSLHLNPSLTREEFVTASLSKEDVSARDKDDATRTIVRVGFMLDCSLKDKYSEGFEVGGYIPAKWESNEPFDAFVERAIVRTSKNHTARQPKEYKKDLKAWKLKKRQRLQFRPTDNIMEHLLYDPETRIVKVFHHTSYLKAHLARSVDQPIELDTHSSLKL